MEDLLPQQIDELRVLFNKLCKTTDGLLGHREISQMLNGIGIKATAQELKEIITDVVGEDEPKIDFNAFVVLMTRRYKQLSFEEEISNLFNTIDVSKDSILDANDIVELFKEHGQMVTVGEANALLQMISDTPQGMCEDELKTFMQTKM